MVSVTMDEHLESLQGLLDAHGEQISEELYLNMLGFSCLERQTLKVFENS